jgi:hypothetical protein
MIGNPLGGTLFIMPHICVFRLIEITHLTCVFPSLSDDTHIIGIALNVILISLRL